MRTKIAYARPVVPWNTIPAFPKAMLVATWTATAVWIGSMAVEGVRQVCYESRLRDEHIRRINAPSED